MAKIPGTAVASPLVPIDSSSTTPTHSARYGKGGLRGVATIAALDDIPTTYREHGMLVFVEALGAYYQCGPGPVFSFGAAPFVPGPSADTIYPNTSSGLAAVGEGDYFYVATSEGLKLYRDVAGAASFVGDFPSLATLSAEVAAAAASVVAAGEAQGLAEDARDEATEQAGIATTQAGIATNQAGIAAAQAGAATNQAGIASGHATQSGIFRDQARAAADATAPQRFFDTYADALAAISTIPDDAVIEVFEDETQDDYRTRYLKEPGNLVLKIRFEADTIRTDLANPDMGAAMVARGVVAVDSIADLLALPDSARRADLRYLVKGYHAGMDVGGGEFYWDAARDKATANGGTIIDPANIGTLSATALGTFLDVQGTGVGTGCWVRGPNDHDAHLPQNFGAKSDGTFDDTQPLQRCIDVLRKADLSAGDWKITDTVTLHSGVILNGSGEVNTRLIFSPAVPANEKPMLYIGGNDNVRVSHMQWVGPGATGNNEIGCDVAKSTSGTFTGSGNRNAFINLRVSGFQKAGFLRSGGWNNTWDHCRIINCGDRGTNTAHTGGIVYVESASLANWSGSGDTLRNSYFSGNSYGLYLDEPWLFTAIEVVFEFNGFAYFYNGTGFSEINCWHESNDNAEVITGTAFRLMPRGASFAGHNTAVRDGGRGTTLIDRFGISFYQDSTPSFQIKPGGRLNLDNYRVANAKGQLLDFTAGAPNWDTPLVVDLHSKFPNTLRNCNLNVRVNGNESNGALQAEYRVYGRPGALVITEVFKNRVSGGGSTPNVTVTESSNGVLTFTGSWAFGGSGFTVHIVGPAYYS